MIGFGSSLIKRYTFRFAGSQIQTCGSAPLVLSLPNRFVPTQCTFVQADTTVPFDFTGFYAIQEVNLLRNVFLSQVVPQGFNDGLMNLFSYTQSLLPVTMIANIDFGGYHLTIDDGIDATQGDSNLTINMIGYILNQ